MAGSKDIEAGRAHIALYIKNSAFVKGLESIGKSLRGVGSSIMGFGARVTAIGAGVVSAMGGAVAMFVSMGSELADVSARTGVAVGSLAELKFAAEQTGASFGDVETAIKNMQKNGFKAEDFDKIAKHISQIEDPATRTARAMEIFGKSGTSLLPMMADLQELRQQARELGLVPTEKAVADADKIGDLFDQIKSAGKAAIFEIGAALAPILIPALETVRGFIVATKIWISENGELFRTIAKIGVGLMIAGGIIATIGAAIFGIGIMFTAVAAIIGGIASVIGFLLTPFGLLVGILTTGIALWATLTEEGKASVATIVADFLSLGEVFGTTWQGIVDAVMAGDLELAAKVAVAGLALVWQVATQEVNRLWEGVKWSFLTSWQEATTWLAKIFTSAWAGLQRGWTTTIAFFTSTWTKFSNFLKDGLNVIQNGIGNAIIDAAENVGAVSKEFAGDWRKELNRASEAEMVDRVKQEQADLKQIEDARKEAEKRINNEEAGALGILEQDKQRRLQELEEQFEADIAAKRKAVEDARKELQDAAGQAAEARDRVEANREAIRRNRPEIGAADLVNKSFTTFSGAALIAQGQGGAQQRLIEEAVRAHAQREAQLRAMRLLQDAVQNNQLQVVG